MLGMRTHSGSRVAWYKVVGFGSLFNLGVCTVYCCPPPSSSQFSYCRYKVYRRDEAYGFFPPGCKGLNARPDQVNTLNDRETATLNDNTAQAYSIHTPFTYIGVHNNAARTKRPLPRCTTLQGVFGPRTIQQ